MDVQVGHTEIAWHTNALAGKYASCTLFGLKGKTPQFQEVEVGHVAQIVSK